MKTSFLSTSTLTLGVVLLMALPALAQQTLQNENPQPTNINPAPTDVAKKVGFRMANWRTIHGDGTPATGELIATLQDIGCEVQQHNHGGHTDIGYRCASWKSIDVRNESESKKWQNWLVNNEFETVVLNPDPTSPLATVKVRLANWQTVHAQSAAQAASLKDMYELIGCEVAIDNHGDHIDTKFRCVKWNTIGLPNAQAAHVWQDWLNRSGFETQHDHSSDGHDAHAGHNHAADAPNAHNHDGHDHGDHSGHNHDH